MKKLAHELTPVEKVDDIWLKRDDLFEIYGATGGKARSCYNLLRNSITQETKGIATAVHRHGPQMVIVARIAHKLGLPAQVHTPVGKETTEQLLAEEAGAEIIRHRYGHTSVIIKRGQDAAKEQSFIYVPFGMECAEAVEQTSLQVENIPAEVKRIVMPVGGGISLSGVLTGLDKFGIDIPILGVITGGSPLKRITKWAPTGWKNRVELVTSPVSYSKALTKSVGGVTLDPHYEAKAHEFTKPGDLLWLVGIRPNIK